MKLEKRLERVKNDVKESDNLFILPALFIFGLIFVIGILGVPLNTVPVAFSLMTLLAFVGIAWGLIISLIKSEFKSKIDFYEEILDEIEASKKN